MGGIGKIRGIVIGVLMLRLIFVGLAMVGVPQDLQYLIKGGIILFACALDMRKYLVKSDLTQRWRASASHLCFWENIWYTERKSAMILHGN